MKTIWAEQYRKPCVVASLTDAADDVIAACRASGAWRMCDIEVRPGVIEHGGGEEFIVQLRDDVGPELWTEAALRWSLGKEV